MIASIIFALLMMFGGSTTGHLEDGSRNTWLRVPLHAFPTPTCLYQLKEDAETDGWSLTYHCES